MVNIYIYVSEAPFTMRFIYTCYFYDSMQLSSHAVYIYITTSIWMMYIIRKLINIDISVGFMVDTCTVKLGTFFQFPVIFVGLCGDELLVADYASGVLKK